MILSVFRPTRFMAGAGLVAALALSLALTDAGRAHAAEATVGLGTATSYAVLASASVSNTGPTEVNGDLGVSPGTAVDGFSVGNGVVNDPGAIHSADAAAAQAGLDALGAYNDAAGRATTANVPVELGGTLQIPGVYEGGTLEVNGPLPLVLDAQGDAGAVFIFKAASTLVTGSASQIQLINGASACNVFWQVGSSATLGTTSDFVGTILASESVTATTGADIQGRLVALNGAVTLDNNTLDAGDCAITPVADDGTDEGTDDGDDDGSDDGGDNGSDDGSDNGDDDGSNGGGGGGGAGDGAGGDTPELTLAATGDDHTIPLIASISALTLGGVLFFFAPRRRLAVHRLDRK